MLTYEAVPHKTGDRWSADDNEYLRKHYASRDIKVATLARRLGRSRQSLNTQARKLGLTNHRISSHRPWQDAEKEMVAELAGEIPFLELLHKLNAWRARHDMALRDATSLKAYGRRNQISFRMMSVSRLTVSDIAQGLRCDRHTINLWIEDKTFRKVLKPERRNPNNSRSPWVIDVRNFKKLIKQYPAAIDGHRPNMPWLVMILTEAKL